MEGEKWYIIGALWGDPCFGCSNGTYVIGVYGGKNFLVYRLVGFGMLSKQLKLREILMSYKQRSVNEYRKSNMLGIYGVYWSPVV